MCLISFANFSWTKVMFWSACIYLFIYLLVCMYVCLLPTFLKNYWTKLHEIFRDHLSSSKDQSIRFWERSGQRSRSRSRKSKKSIFVITRSVFVWFMWNQRQYVHFSIPYLLIWWPMWHWRRYALYRVVCMYVTNFFQKLLDRIAWNFQGRFVIIQGPID